MSFDNFTQSLFSLRKQTPTDLRLYHTINEPFYQHMTAFRFSTFLVILLITLTGYVPQPDNADALVGRWLSARKKNQVEIYRQGNKYYGKLVWMAEPDDPSTKRPKLDRQNPDEKLRNRPLMHMDIMTNLVYKGNNSWVGGQIYNPEDGKTYDCDITMKDANAINLHGYVMGIPLLGKTSTWTRIK